MIITSTLARIHLIAILIVMSTFAWASDPLPSWKDGQTKTRILQFVATVTDQNSEHFVPPAERIATFDNDGTLWSEQPVYTQLSFALDRVKTLAPQHPEWKSQQPFKAALENDMKTLSASGEKGLLELVMASHSGMSTDTFTTLVLEWFQQAQHPRFNRPYTETAYQPMLELLAYLRNNEFKTYIVSGGGIEFMRPISESLYGIPPEQVIGSSIKTRYEVKNGNPVLTRLGEIGFINDKAGKPVAINEHIGRRPIAAFGNSDGDQQMLEWTGASQGARLMMLVFHDDKEREYAYGPANGLPASSSGHFSQNLMDKAKKNNWTVISMKDDWKTVFPANN
ncbi:HAD family hydrolase [Ketobacter sp.]|uniref:HAD family hydrolase n=1 Tax=Ketobacter sp. TaxID=2083498 RepID=UPI000F20FCEE|nr:HAD family hydrolase [Ketobacter sp.]RLT97450.1 MAG: haloacid dehalogenase-like hydrolase [Ketobacter sp.]